MSKILKNSLVVGALLPLHIFGVDNLDKVVVQDVADKKSQYKEKKFFKSYSSNLILKDELNQESIFNVKDALKNISNVKIKDRGAFNRSISIRGMSGERVVSIVDGTKMSNHGISMGGGGELGLVESSSVEQIEVVKGSPSIVYDPGATGGVVKVTTIKNNNSIEDSVALKHTYLNDSGYKLIKNSTTVEGEYKDLFLHVDMAKANSNGLSVKNEDKIKSVIHDINVDDNRFGTEHEVKNLGYSSISKSLISNYQVSDLINVYYKMYDTDNEGITSIYGMFSPRAVHTDEYNLDGDILGIRLKELWGFNQVDLFRSTMNTQKVSYDDGVINDLKLKTNTIKLATEYYFDNFLLLGGIEQTKDTARTYTHSRMTYNAMYLSTEYISDNYTVVFGLRNNIHEVVKDLKEGERADVCKDKVGISGCPDPKHDQKLNYSSSIIYSLNDTNNVAFNYSRTYRYPSLYERFAYGGSIIGGEMDMKAEEADNYEISWKYLDDSLTYSLALFHSKFDTYNAIRTKNELKSEYIGNPDELEKCDESDNCDPFNSMFIFSSFNDVTSQGFEFELEKKFDRQNIVTNFTLGQTIKSNSTYQTSNMPEAMITKFKQEPLELVSSIKKTINHKYKPWVKLRIRHMTNEPKVEQEDGFSAFTVGDIYFGAKYKKYLTCNIGIRNITDEIYHEPYSPIDGVKRSLFFNVSMAVEKLF